MDRAEDMTTHEQDMMFYQDNLVKILEQINTEIEDEINAYDNDMYVEKKDVINLVDNIISGYIDKAKAIQSIQNKGERQMQKLFDEIKEEIKRIRDVQNLTFVDKKNHYYQKGIGKGLSLALQIVKKHMESKGV